VAMSSSVTMYSISACWSQGRVQEGRFINMSRGGLASMLFGAYGGGFAVPLTRDSLAAAWE
jgi:hypothetical protein